MRPHPSLKALKLPKELCQQSTCSAPIPAHPVPGRPLTHQHRTATPHRWASRQTRPPSRCPSAHSPLWVSQAGPGRTRISNLCRYMAQGCCSLPQQPQATVQQLQLQQHASLTGGLATLADDLLSRLVGVTHIDAVVHLGTQRQSIQDCSGNRPTRWYKAVQRAAALFLRTLGPLIWKPSLMTVSKLVEASPFIQMSASCSKLDTCENGQLWAVGTSSDRMWNCRAHGRLDAWKADVHASHTSLDAAHHPTRHPLTGLPMKKKPTSVNSSAVTLPISTSSM